MDLSEREKLELQNLIELELTRSEQMELLMMLMSLPEEIYKQTSSCTMFDLNDVPSKNLREMYDLVLMTMRNKIRQIELTRVIAEHDIKLCDLSSKLMGPL